MSDASTPEQGCQRRVGGTGAGPAIGRTAWVPRGQVDDGDNNDVGLGGWCGAGVGRRGGPRRAMGMTVVGCGRGVGRRGGPRRVGKIHFEV
jgi:hypothetical protein